jgi:hypothetical protein
MVREQAQRVVKHRDLHPAVQDNLGGSLAKRIRS